MPTPVCWFALFLWGHSGRCGYGYHSSALHVLQPLVCTVGACTLDVGCMMAIASTDAQADEVREERALSYSRAYESAYNSSFK
jgi:hypothetical protein